MVMMVVVVAGNLRVEILCGGAEATVDTEGLVGIKLCVWRMRAERHWRQGRVGRDTLVRVHHRMRHTIACARKKRYYGRMQGHVMLACG